MGKKNVSLEKWHLLLGCNNVQLVISHNPLSKQTPPLKIIVRLNDLAVPWYSMPPIYPSSGGTGSHWHVYWVLPHETLWLFSGRSNWVDARLSAWERYRAAAAFPQTNGRSHAQGGVCLPAKGGLRLFMLTLCNAWGSPLTFQSTDYTLEVTWAFFFSPFGIQLSFLSCIGY